MNTPLARMLATMFIWLALISSIWIVTGLPTEVDPGVANTTIIVVGVVAALSTIGIWATGDNADKDRQARAEKDKRITRVEKILDKLSDAELAELRKRLSDEGVTDSDGELVTLETLMNEHDQRQREKS